MGFPIHAFSVVHRQCKMFINTKIHYEPWIFCIGFFSRFTTRCPGHRSIRENPKRPKVIFFVSFGYAQMHYINKIIISRSEYVNRRRFMFRCLFTILQDIRILFFFIIIINDCTRRSQCFFSPSNLSRLLFSRIIQSFLCICARVSHASTGWTHKEEEKEKKKNVAFF